MKVVIHLLHREQLVKDRLARHGWKLEGHAGNAMTASHPAVKTVFDARHSLNELGLLTSSALRIEFQPGMGCEP